MSEHEDIVTMEHCREVVHDLLHNARLTPVEFEGYSTTHSANVSRFNTVHQNIT